MRAAATVFASICDHVIHGGMGELPLLGVFQAGVQIA